MRVDIAGEGVRTEGSGGGGAHGTGSTGFSAATPEALVLVDGTPSPPGMDTGCRHGTPWFARRLGVHLLARLVDREDRTMAQCLADALAETAALHGARCDLAHPNTPSATVAAARLRGSVVEYLVLGDALLVVDTGAHGGIRVHGDNQPFPAGEELRRRLRAVPPGSPQRATLRQKYAMALCAARNTGHGPWAAAALPRAAEHAETGSVRRADLRALAALSAGAAAYVTRFSLGDWPHALTMMDRSGPQELLRKLRAAEATDPQCSRWPRDAARADAAAVYSSGW
jgi:hypothetical protein